MLPAHDSYLVKEFGSNDLEHAQSQKEWGVIDSFASILRDALYDIFTIECDEDTCIDDDEDLTCCGVTSYLQESMAMD
ncbi:hypothetical protein Aduo_012081 [Ancylostoma duodenale]